MKITRSCPLFATPETVAHQAPLSMEFFSQEYQRELPFPSPGYFPNPGMEPRSPTLQADSLPSESHRVKILLFKSLTHTLLSRLQGIPLRGIITSLVGKIPWRREWQPTPVFLPGESHGQRNLVDYSPKGRKEPHMTEYIQKNIIYMAHHILFFIH